MDASSTTIFAKQDASSILATRSCDYSRECSTKEVRAGLRLNGRLNGDEHPAKFGAQDSFIRYGDAGVPSGHWSPGTLLRGGALVAHKAHNLEVGGSIPSPATHERRSSAPPSFVRTVRSLPRRAVLLNTFRSSPAPSSPCVCQSGAGLLNQPIGA